jgi:hypothetical protein
MEPPAKRIKLTKNDMMPANKVIKSNGKAQIKERRPDVRVKQNMIKEPFKSIDLFINLEKRKFTKDSEQLLIGIYAVDKHLKDYQHVDGSKY